MKKWVESKKEPDIQDQTRRKPAELLKCETQKLVKVFKQIISTT